MSKLRPRFRFLPVTIFAAALMLTVKLGDIWEGFDGILNGTISVAPAIAQQRPADAPPAAATEQLRRGEERAAGQAEKEGETEGEDEEEVDAASVLLEEDPTLLTQTEIDLLQQLAERRERLEAREQELELRAGLLRAAETRIDSKIEDLRRLQSTIEELIKTYDDQQAAKMQSLVKIYQNMKPKEAARIFEELDLDTLLAVAELMNERKLAPIMAKMDPRKAKQMTVELTRLRELPKPGSAVGG